ncbi:hypothetical protein TgHK011_003074 [Trichoderma gracile]|nr:hypothetical protein TgHK011_003074 [Trichoderma gracile]
MLCLLLFCCVHHVPDSSPTIGTPHREVQHKLYPSFFTHPYNWVEGVPSLFTISRREASPPGPHNAAPSAEFRIIMGPRGNDSAALRTDSLSQASTYKGLGVSHNEL